MTSIENKLEYSRNYYQKNKETINLKKNEKFECPICHGKYLHTARTTHFKTKKHITALEFTKKIDELSKK